MSGSYHRADVIHGRCDDKPSVVAAVYFHGIEKTKHDALIKEISELYNSRTVDELVTNSYLAAKHMQEVGLLDGCTPLIDTSKTSSTGYVVNFVVKEPSSITLGAKLGMTTHGEADACLTGGKRSFNGRGESFDASYSKTLRGGHSFNFSVMKPFLGWQKYSSIGTSIYRSYEALRWNKAEFAENGLILKYSGQLFNKRVKHSLKLNNLWRTFYPVDSSFSVREQAGHSTKFSIENNFSIDTRDRPILARKGYLASLTEEWAGLIGDASFMRHQIDLQAAAPFLLGSFVSASLQCNIVQPTHEKTLHLLDRAYLGGPHDIRGFEMRSLGKRDGDASLGGAASFAMVAHLYRPLIPAEMLFAHAFLTAGTVSSMDENMNRRFAEELAQLGGENLMKLFFATGNKNKFNEMQYLGRNAFEMSQYPLEIPEIQGNVEEIIAAKIEEARKLSTCFPILVDDTALEIEALNGWPGPYVKEFLQSFKADGIVKLVSKIDPTNSKAKAICSLGYLKSAESEPVFGFGYVEGELKLRSDEQYSGFGFDPVFFPGMDGKSFEDLTLEEKGNMSHRAGALLDLCKKLQK